MRSSIGEDRFAVDNSYFTSASICFRQLIGTLMGSDPAPLMASLFLYYCTKGSAFFRQKKRDLQKTRIFSVIFRFIDDLCTFNNDELENNYNNIYPHELELKKKNEDPCKASFLDLSEEVYNRKFSTNLLDKRDAFPFYSNRMPYLDSNTIPCKIFDVSVGAETLRIAWTTASD